jgi:hypothetical protein
LNPEFEGRCATMFHQDTLPTLDEACQQLQERKLDSK